MAKSLIIKPAFSADSETIADFNSRLAEETEGKALDRPTLESGVAAVLADPDKGRYFLAWSKAGEVVGQLMITREWSDWRNGFFWWLQSVYVIPEYRKRGVFSALLNHVSELARADPDVRGIRLYVDRDNAPARSVYAARGFDGAHYEVMEREFSS